MDFELDHFHLLCADLEASVRYFQKIFDAKVTLKSEATGRKIVRLKLGNADLALSEAKDYTGDLAPKPANIGPYQLGLRVKDIFKTTELLRKRGANITKQPYQVKPGLWAAFILACDGMEIELMQSVD